MQCTIALRIVHSTIDFTNFVCICIWWRNGHTQGSSRPLSMEVSSWRSWKSGMCAFVQACVHYTLHRAIIFVCVRHVCITHCAVCKHLCMCEGSLCATASNRICVFIQFLTFNLYCFFLFVLCTFGILYLYLCLQLLAEMLQVAMIATGHANRSRL